MQNRLLIAVAAAGTIAGWTGLAQAESIKSQVPSSVVNSYCQSAGLGEHMATVTLSDNTTVTGSVDCESENMSAGSPSAGVAPAGTVDPNAPPEDSASTGTETEDNSTASGTDDSNDSNQSSGSSESSGSSSGDSGGSSGGGDSGGDSGDSGDSGDN
jgi:hypothetical protein